MVQNASGYSPNTLTVKKGIPVKWVITSKDVNTCASSLVSSSLKIRKGLSLGENIIEFTPTETGVLKFSCSMGMYRGSFNVIENDGSDSIVAVQSTPQPTPSSTPTSTPAPISQRKITPTPAATSEPVVSKPTSQEDVQILKMTYTQDNDIQPNTFTAKVGQPVRMEIDVQDDGYGCMGSIMVPGLTQTPEVFEKGKPIVFNFTPNKAGEYLITCAMGIPRGVIKVN